MKPFAQLIKDRMSDPQKAAAEAVARLERWKQLSGSARVSLDDVAWLGAVFALAGVHQVDDADQVVKEVDGNVTSVVASDGARAVRDYVSSGG